MSSTITYKGNTLTTVNNQTKVLNTRGTWLEDNITVTDITSSSGGNGIETLTILSEQSITATTLDTYGYTANISVTESLIDGENYIVTMDGESYLCYAHNKYGNDDIYMGDDNNIWGDPSRAQYPFLVATFGNGVTAWGVPDTSAHTVKIEKVISIQVGTPAISVVDTLDAKGGTVRTITALDISDTTATASDVAVGKYFYTSNGTKTAGASSGGGSSGQSATGTISGDGTNVLEISCNFEPDLIHVYTDMSDDASKIGVASFIIIKDSMSQLMVYGSTSNTNITVYEHFTSITGYGNVESAHGTYSNGTLTLTTVGNSSALKFLSGQTYTYELKTLGSGTPSATAHTIYFEFTDETNASIVAYYDDPFIGSAITATKPVIYGQKTVDSASLDGVQWYANIGYEVLYNNSIELDSYDSSLYGKWLGRVADTEAEDGSEWRVTINNTVYDCLAENDGLNVSGDNDWSIRLDGLGGGQCMFYYSNPPSPNITLKIERKATS